MDANYTQELSFHTRILQNEYACMLLQMVNALADLQQEPTHDILGRINERWKTPDSDGAVGLILAQLQHLRPTLHRLRSNRSSVAAHECSCLLQTISLWSLCVFIAGVEA